MEEAQKRNSEVALNRASSMVRPTAANVQPYPGDWKLLDGFSRLNSYTALRSHSYPSAFTFATWVGNDLRTCGVVIHRPAHQAANLDDLDLDSFARAAAGRDGASARGKVVLVGWDGALVLQTSPVASPEPVACGNGIAAVAQLPGFGRTPIKVFGRSGKVFEATLISRGSSVAQTWTMASPTYCEDSWRGRSVLRLDVLNPYAILEGPIPAGVTPEQARQTLVGEQLSAKLAVVEPSPTGALVSFYNAGGAHGAAPMTGLVTLAIAARLSPWAANVFTDGKTSYRTKAGLVTEPLLAVSGEVGGPVSVSMPTVWVRLSPVAAGGTQ